nr:hypothetical protein [Gaetbulibacter sp. 4G1]
MRKTAKTPITYKSFINRFLLKLKPWLIEEETKEEGEIKLTKINRE